MSDAFNEIPGSAMHYALFFDRMHWGSFLSSLHTDGVTVRVELIGNDTQQGNHTTFPIANAGQTYPWILFKQGVGRLLQQVPMLEVIQ
jgi:hypothetical protein